MPRGAKRGAQNHLCPLQPQVLDTGGSEVVSQLFVITALTRAFARDSHGKR